MMNPQYLPPGQNNNAPSNPIGFPPTSQEFNGVQNANIYSQMPSNGPQMPPKPFNPNEVTQKMQNVNLNGPPGFIPPTQLPPGQLPPGANFPPMSNIGSGQLPQSQRPSGPFPPNTGVTQMPPMPQKPQLLPQSSTPGPNPSSQPQNIGQMTPMNQGSNSLSNQQGPPRPSQPGHPPAGAQMVQPSQPSSNQGLPRPFPPHSQPGFSQSLEPMGRPATIPPPGLSKPTNQAGFQTVPSPQGPPLGHPEIPPLPQSSIQQSLPPQPGMPPSSMQNQAIAPISKPQPTQPGQFPNQPPKQVGPPSGFPSQPSHLGLTSQPGPMPQQQSHMSGPQGFPPQSSAPQPNQISRQAGVPPQPGQMPGQQVSMPGQLGLSPQQGPFPGQPSMPPMPSTKQAPMLGQSNIPPAPQPGSMSGHPGMPPNMPPAPQSGHSGMPPPPQPGSMPGQPGLQQPGQIQGPPGLPPQSGQPPSSQAQFNQPMTGLPHMPPPLTQQRQYPGMPPASQQPGPPGPPTSSGYGMPPIPGQQSQMQQGYNQPPSGYPPQFQPQYPGQQQQYPAQQQQYPTQQQQYPGQQQQFPGQQPSYPGQPGYQTQPQKRLDPDQMPSPIQVMADDQQNRSGVFVTNEKGAVPPLVTTDFIVDDKGNASPRYIRSSMYSVPVTADLLKQTSIPFCLVICPMAETVGNELPPPLLDFASLTGSPTMGPVRCSRCKAYMCPNMKFIDAGRHFKCAFCKATTEVPMEYTQYINSMQQYGRVPAELALGTYEILATKEYCRNNTLPNPPAMVFLIDVSYNSIKSGLLQTVCDNIMDLIDALPKDEQTGHSWTRVGFITYSSTVHFYNIKGTLAQPQMLSVGDVNDMFVPLLEGFLVRAEDSGAVLTALLQQLPELFRDNKETETVLLPAVQAGLEALKAADTSGQLIVFHTSLPSYNAPGKLINREDRKLLGTEKEKQILTPQTTAYNELGQACCAAGVSVELFVCNNAYVDVATIGQLPRLTGGQLHKYTYFTADVDGMRLVRDVRRVCARASALDAVMRVRSSSGVRPTDFYGHFYMANTTDVELAAIDADKAIGVEIKHDDKLTSEDGVYIQAALLYTHRSGQRRLRILNLALNVAHQLADVYRSMELDTTINFLAKQAVWALRELPPRAVREGLSARCARSLAAYRRHCASPSSAGQLVLPESMKLLPLYTSCLLRSDAIAGGPDITCDDRSAAMHRVLSAHVPASVVLVYPRLLPLHLLPGHLTPLRASIDKMNDHGVYLLENGVHMLLWVGSQASPDFVRDVFGVTSPQLIDTQVCELPELDTELSEAVRAVVEDAREKRHTAMRLTIMRQHDKLEVVLRHFLVEDRGVDGSASYVDYLCHVHKEIRAIL